LFLPVAAMLLRLKNPNVGSETQGVGVLANMGNATVEGFTVTDFRNGIVQGMAAREGTTFIVKNNKVILKTMIPAHTCVMASR
jgi:hypothetical protein